MSTILATLIASDGTVAAPAAYAANPDGTAPALLTLPGAAGMFARGPVTPTVQGTQADVYALSGISSAPGEQADTDASVPGRANPGLADPGDPGGIAIATVYVYTYAYSAPVLTTTGDKNGGT